MRKDFLTDYLSYILFRIMGYFFRRLPKGFGLFLGRRLGGLLYYFDFRHKAVVYSNMKRALGNRLSPRQLSNLVHEFYRTFGQNLIEIFFIPLINKDYLDKYIILEGRENIFNGFKEGKGVILLAVHEGSWELSSIISANLGFPFNMFVRQQTRYQRIERFLNIYRVQKGGKLIQRENQTRQLVEALRKNEAIGMTLDQGGKAGTVVDFFGRGASMSTGALRLALKYGTVLLPVFYVRLNGPYFKIIIEPPFRLKKTEDTKKDIQDNLQALVAIFEKYIRKYPKEYLWSYKIWKYGRDRSILILSDGKTGHLRQGQAVAGIIKDYLQEKGFQAQIDCLQARFKNRFAKKGLILSSCLSGKYFCQGCMLCLKRFLEKQSYDSLLDKKPDIIVSAGSSLAALNYLLARENLAKSIVVLRPSILSTKRFDLVIMPKHDHPPKRKNVVATSAALNLVDSRYLEEQAEKLAQASNPKLWPSGFYIGVLIGGDSKDFVLKKDTLALAIQEIKAAAQNLGADLLITTSRRTSTEAEGLIKEEFQNYPRCKLLVIANQKNIPQAVGGILGLSKLVICSAESISMVSEAVNSRKYVLVFGSCGLSNRHLSFLKYLAKNKYIYLAQTPSLLAKRIEELWQLQPAVPVLSDNIIVKDAIGRIL